MGTVGGSEFNGPKAAFFNISKTKQIFNAFKDVDFTNFEIALMHDCKLAIMRPAAFVVRA